MLRPAAIAGLLGALLSSAAPVRAGDLSVSLTTLFRAYDYVDLEGETVRFRTLTPSVVASATNLLNRDFSFVANARYLASFAEPEEDHSDLLYAVLSWRDPSRRLNLSAGRQVRAQGPGFIRYDGVHGSYRFGQFEVGGALGFGFERDGRKYEYGRYTGAELAWRPRSWASLQGRFERGTEDDIERLYKYSLDGMLRPARDLTVRGSWLYNAAVEEMDELLGTVEWRRGAVRLQAEAGRIHPHFDPDSIWNVFNSGPYDRYQARVACALGGEREVWARYERRQYGSDRGNNAGTADPGFRSANDTASLGFGRNGRSGLSWSGEMFLNSGFGGFRTGASLRLGSELGFLPGRIDGGVDFRAYDRAFRDSRQDLTTAYWAEAVLRFGRFVRLRMRAEDYRNGFLLDDFRFTAKLDLSSEESFK